MTFSASGWTYRNPFVLYDYETESMWYHLPGDEVVFSPHNENRMLRSRSFVTISRSGDNIGKDGAGRCSAINS